MDFYKIRERSFKKGYVDIFPDFVVGRVKDLMIRGKNFYAVWDEEKGLWSTDEYDVARIVDKDLMDYYEKKSDTSSDVIFVKKMSDYSAKSWDEYKRYISKAPDNYHQLDTKVTFANTEVKKTDYVSRRLPYPLEDGSYDAYEELVSTLYDPEERQKIEWAIGAIISGDAKRIQKFVVFYGDAGAGKSTILNIIQKLFEGYYTTFDAKELASTNNSFATDAFSNDPLVAIQHDGDLSGIKDNSKLNSIVSHEEIIVNEKFKARYSTRANCFLFMATNKPVKITDGKSGLIRRLIDVKPSGRRLPEKKYQQLYSQIDFELGAIAKHCLDVYNEMGRGYYSSYRPLEMMYKTDPFFNFVEDSFDIFKEQDGVSLKQAYAMYKEYCNDSGAEYKMQMYKFREELKNYFKEYYDDIRLDDGSHVRSYFKGFQTKKFERVKGTPDKKEPHGLKMECTESLLDGYLKDYPAQYAKEDETPSGKWEYVRTTLNDICTTKLHYVKVPENLVVIDFDLKDEKGNKSKERNLEAASKWPKTYAEFSKGGAGVHLHYIYDGDTSQLSRVYDDNIEIKVFNGNSSLRRRLTYCNDIPIATISSGLPLKEKGDKMVNFEAVKSEKGLRVLVMKNLNKEIHPATKPSIDFIVKILDDAYANGLKYDISDMEPQIIAFAANSSHNADYCLKQVNKMKLASDSEPEWSEAVDEDSPLIFYDVEVFPNLFLINWKAQGSDKVVRMINPSPTEVEELMKHKLVGFNCRRYDNHILYARMMGYSLMELYNLSQKIVTGKKGCMFLEAYNVSYTDVYDYAAKKQSLKKWEIELGIHHQELGLPWDQPVDESLWQKVAEYCDNDVIATEAVWNATQGDFTAREILADIAGGTVNDSTNSLTTRLIFGKEKHPQSEFMYRDLSKPVKELPPDMEKFLKKNFPEMMKEKHHGDSLLPYFPGYSYVGGVSTYKGYEVGEGGFVWAKPGMYRDVVTFDVASMHPHSVMAEYLFGLYTETFHDLVESRIDIKHKDFEKAFDLFEGKLTKYLKDEKKAKSLAGALKIAINSVYGLTAAKFENAFKDNRNIDNIVAKRGALFMIDLLTEVQKMGGTVVHIKTDSIKIANPTKEITEFVLNFGKRYGYSFEVEHKFEKICLVNNAVYIAKCSADDPEEPGKWTATGTQFAVPYVFKTLFSKEAIEFSDLCETKSVTSSLYLDMNEGLPDVSEAEKQFKKYESDYKKGLLSDTSFEKLCQELSIDISKGHNYVFVGKVGEFCPIKPGEGGGELVREKDGKYSSATGAKDYRWLESEMVKVLKKEESIDKSYYTRLVDEAIETIKQYGDIEEFLD